MGEHSRCVYWYVYCSYDTYQAHPRFLSVAGIRVKVWFKGQPVVCNICCKEGHRAGSCPDKGKCLWCHESGHFARNCPQPWGRFSGPPAVATAGDHPHAGNGAPNVYFAEDLDRGFQAPADDDHVVADAPSVAEAVIRDEVSSVVSGDCLLMRVMRLPLVLPALSWLLLMRVLPLIS